MVSTPQGPEHHYHKEQKYVYISDYHTYTD
jgi:hypothetical protein